jgi:hypothetical protein
MPAPPHRIRSASVQLDVNLLRQRELFESLVLAHITRDHLFHLLRLQQQPNSEIVHAGVVRNQRQILRSLALQRRNQIFRNTTQSESADQNRRPILNLGDRRIGITYPLVHQFSWSLTFRRATVPTRCRSCGLYREIRPICNRSS